MILNPAFYGRKSEDGGHQLGMQYVMGRVLGMYMSMKRGMEMTFHTLNQLVLVTGLVRKKILRKTLRF